VMIDVSRMNSIWYEEQTKSIVAETGANLGMLMHKLHEVNRSAPHGDAMAVGLGGHGLHGGWDALMSRQYGLLTQNIVGGEAVLWNGEATSLTGDLLFLARGGGFEDIGIAVNVRIVTWPRPKKMCTVARITQKLPRHPFMSSGFVYATKRMPENIGIGWKITHEVVKQGMWFMGESCEDVREVLEGHNRELFGTSQDEKEWWFKAEHNPPNGSVFWPMHAHREQRDQRLDDLLEARLSSYSDILKDDTGQLATTFSYEYELQPRFFDEGDRYIEMAQSYLTQRSFYVPTSIFGTNTDCGNIFHRIYKILLAVGDYNANITCDVHDGNGRCSDKHKLYAFTTIAPAGGALTDWSSVLQGRQGRGVEDSSVSHQWHEPEDEVGAAIRPPGDVWIFRFECHWYDTNPQKKTMCFKFALEYELAVGPCSNDGIFLADRWPNSWGHDAFYSDCPRVKQIKHKVWSEGRHSGFVGDLPNMLR